MGTSKNAAHLASKLHVLAASIPAAGTVGLVKAAAAVEVAVAAASGRYRGSQLTQTRATVTESKALVRMTSRKAHLLDHDTHFPQKSRSLSASRPFVPRDGVRTQGKFMWERGVTASRPAILRAMSDALGGALGKVFGK